MFSAIATEANSLGTTGANIPIQSEEVNHLKGTAAFEKIKSEALVYLCAI